MSSNVLEDRIKQWTKSYSIKIGKNTQEDIARFIELYNSIYARKISTSYYDWRFFNNRSQGTLVFAFKENELIGACGYNFFDFAGPFSMRNAMLVDMMVNEKHRNIGLAFSRLNLEVEELSRQGGAKCIYLFPNQRGAAAWLASEGWVRITQMKTCSIKTLSTSQN